MTYILYGYRRSGSCMVELALAEIGAQCEVRNVDLTTEQQRGSDYAARNPQRKLPTLLTPAGETLTESAAILLTLAERHPEAGLLPPIGGAERARALRWLVFVAAEIYPIVEINDYPERFAPPSEEARRQVRESARGLWRQRWLIVEAQLANGPFLLGPEFSLTDLDIAVVSRWAQQDDWRPEHLPKVERLAAAVAARPALAPIWARHFG